MFSQNSVHRKFLTELFKKLKGGRFWDTLYKLRCWLQAAAKLETLKIDSKNVSDYLQQKSKIVKSHSGTWSRVSVVVTGLITFDLLYLRHRPLD